VSGPWLLSKPKLCLSLLVVFLRKILGWMVVKPWWFWSSCLEVLLPPNPKLSGNRIVIYIHNIWRLGGSWKILVSSDAFVKLCSGMLILYRIYFIRCFKVVLLFPLSSICTPTKQQQQPFLPTVTVYILLCSSLSTTFYVMNSLYGFKPPASIKRG